MIKQYKPTILNIELLSNIISISINKNIYINFNEIIKKQNIEVIIELINYILVKNYIKKEALNLITLNYGIHNYTNSKIISAIIQSISLSLKIPTIKISLSYDLALNISNLKKKKYTVITNIINEKYISQEIYINKQWIKIISKNLLNKRKNNIIVKYDTKEIIKNINIYRNRKILPSIYAFLFINKKKIFNKFEPPSKIIPSYINKNFYSYYSK